MVTAVAQDSNPKKTIDSIEVQVGSSNSFVDFIRNLLSLPTKFMLFNSKINSGNVSKNTINKMREYLDENGLHDVAISVNQYKPGWIWSRIFSNPRTSTLTKYTFGIGAAIEETLLIPKLTGIPGDHYDFTSNTVHVFSDDPSLALQLCGQAKNFNEEESPTLYALPKALPVIGPFYKLYLEYAASDNAITHLRSKNLGNEVRQAFKILIPTFFSLVAAIATSPEQVYTEPKKYFSKVLGIMAIGHCVGRALAYLETDQKPEDKSKDKEPLVQQG